MKKLAKIIAAAVCAASVLSLSACSGCSGTTTYTTSTSPNWQIRVSAADELDGNAFWLTHAETAEYSLSLRGGSNNSYSVEYSDDGTYTTKLYATVYDWSGQDVPEDLRIENTTDYIYVYETALYQPGAFVFGGERLEFVNEIKTVSYFRSAGNNLLPVYSMQDIKCVSANALQPVSLADCYIRMDRLYTTYYSRDGVTAITSVEVRDEDEESGFESTSYSASVGTEYSLFDASSLGIALRSMGQSGTNTFDVYIPINGAKAQYQAAWSGPVSVDRNSGDYSSIVTAMDAAEEDGYLLLGTNDEGKIDYSFTPVTVSLVSNMTGPSTTYYYASISNTDMNVGRAVLMRVEEALTFSLGTVIYNLTSLECLEISDAE